MKKLLLITMMACLIGTFTACGKEEVQVSSTQEIVEEHTSEKETQESSDKEENKESAASESKEEIKEEPSSESKEETKEEPPVKDEVAEALEILSLKETYAARYEWQDALWLLYSEYSNVTMWEGSEQYSEIDRVLSETAGMQTRSMEDEADNILSFIAEMGMLDGDLTDFETQEIGRAHV